ncbi:hypothetical protein [Clostridium estertheticum]|nr:hypothetical protein [Clostridium estertheticum]
MNLDITDIIPYIIPYIIVIILGPYGFIKIKNYIRKIGSKNK